MNLFFLIVIPFLVLIVLNAIIYIKIKGFEKRSRENETSQFQLRVSFARNDFCRDSSRTISTLDSSSKLLLSPKSSLTTSQRKMSMQPSTFSADLTSATSFIVRNDTNRQKYCSTSKTSLTVDEDSIKYKTTKNSIHDDLSTEYRNGYKRRISKKCQNHEDGYEIRNGEHYHNLEPSYQTTNSQQSEKELLSKFKTKKRCRSEAHIMKMDVRKRPSIIETMHMRLRENSSSNNIVSVRKRELILARISIYIVFVMLICHSIRLIPNTYEMIQTYTQVSCQSFV